MNPALPVKISYDGLAGVDGSARFTFGNVSSALASVSGPVAARPNSEHPARATIEVHVRPLSGTSGTAEKHLSAAFKGIFERACILSQHPRTLIQIVVQALSSSQPPSPSIPGPWCTLIAAEINACSLALLNAGSIPMRGVVCAVALGRHSEGGRVKFVPNPVEERTLDGAGCFAFLFGGVGSGPNTASRKTEGSGPSEVVWRSFRGASGASPLVDVHEVTKATETARKEAYEVWLYMKQSVAKLMSPDDGDVKMET